MIEHTEIRFKVRSGQQDPPPLSANPPAAQSSSDHQNSLWMAHWTTHMQQNNQNTLVIGMNRRTSTSTSTSTTTTSHLLGGTGTTTNHHNYFDFYFNSLPPKSKGACDPFPMYGIKKKLESILKLNPKGKGKGNLNFMTFHSSDQDQDPDQFHFESQEQNPKNHQLTALQSCSSTEEGEEESGFQIKCQTSHSNRTYTMDSADHSLKGASKRKAVSLFEMVSLPTESYHIAHTKRQLKSCEDYMGHKGMIDNVTKSEGEFEQNHALLRDDTKDRGPVEDLASSRAQKVRTCHNSTRIDYSATASHEKSSFKGLQIGSLNINQEPCPSPTVTMDAAESLLKSNWKKQEGASDQDGHGNRWLKRLKYNITGNALMMNPKQLFKLKKHKLSEEKQKQEMKCWVKRWCVKELASEEHELEERQFPSIHAMAMMGKAMNKMRPGEFEKRGPSVVWNNNEF